MKEEFCIMPMNDNYSTTRFNGSERNEIFEGRNRQKSIKYGLIVFLTHEQHRTGKHSFHKSPKEWLWLKKLGQETWKNYYNKTREDFIKEFGKAYDRY